MHDKNVEVLAFNSNVYKKYSKKNYYKTAHSIGKSDTQTRRYKILSIILS